MLKFRQRGGTEFFFTTAPISHELAAAKKAQKMARWTEVLAAGMPPGHPAHSNPSWRPSLSFFLSSPAPCFQQTGGLDKRIPGLPSDVPADADGIPLRLEDCRIAIVELLKKQEALQANRFLLQRSS